MRVSTSACISVLMTSTMTRIENLVEGTAAEELSEHVFWIAEHEREAAKDEVVFERIVLVSSPVLVIAIVCVVVS